MAPDADPIDRRSFAVRREVRDILGRLLDRGDWGAQDFDVALAALGKRRKLALRQLLRFFAEGRVVDEVAGLEVLGRLSEPDDDPSLARMVNDRTLPEGARVACALVLLGHDHPALITAPDVSGMVLRWQARYVAEETSLREPLMRLYAQADRTERASWAALQDAELSEPEGRAAVFEMLLEIESDPDLRGFLLEALSRVPDAASRAALRRIVPACPEERDIITGALAALAAAADPERVPAGWSARVGFCDGTGSFPLRVDFRGPGRRPRSAVFVINYETGVREALPLSGAEVRRYDELCPEHPAATASDEASTMMFPLPVQEALGLLAEGERLTRRQGRTPPRDHARARQLLDPLADVQPRLPEPLPMPNSLAEARRTAELLDHPGYAGWFYDAGDHVLDDLRLEVLHKRQIGADDGIVNRAAERLGQSGEPRRLLRMLRHNGLVHRAAGEPELAALSMAAAGVVGTGGFIGLPLVRRMLRESLHPGHYFFTPMPEVPERIELAASMIGPHRPLKMRVLAVDLGMIIARAVEVWLSRTSSSERPHGDHVQQVVGALAQAGARIVVRAGEHLVDETAATPSFTPAVRARLRRRYAEVLAALAFPQTMFDPEHERLLALVTRASEALVMRTCLAGCPQRCPLDPAGSGRQALRPGVFPAGYEAELFIRTWPGLFLHEPSPAERAALSAFIKRPRLELETDDAAERRQPFRCALCGEERPHTTRARTVLVPHEGGRPQAVCRRCRDRYRRDPAYRAEVIVRHGKLL